MNILLWVLQSVAALMYGASGISIFELICSLGLILPAAFRCRPTLTVVAAALLALERLDFVLVHAKYHEVGSIIMVSVLGLLMAFIAFGRVSLKPIN